MQTELIVVLFVVLFNPVSSSLSVGPRDAFSKQYFDLSYPFDKDTIYFPGQRQYELHMDYSNVTRGGFMYGSVFYRKIMPKTKFSAALDIRHIPFVWQNMVERI